VFRFSRTRAAFTNERGARRIARCRIISCNVIRSRRPKRVRISRVQESYLGLTGFDRPADTTKWISETRTHFEQRWREAVPRARTRRANSDRQSSSGTKSANFFSLPLLSIEIGILNGNDATCAYGLTLTAAPNRYSSVTAIMLYSADLTKDTPSSKIIRVASIVTKIEPESRESFLTRRDSTR